HTPHAHVLDPHAGPFSPTSAQRAGHLCARLESALLQLEGETMFVPRRVRRRPKSLRWCSGLTALALAAGFLTAVVTASLVTSTPALADPVPPAPAGWTTVFGDDFAGPAGSPPSFANWFYDIGTGFGTGEKEHTTNSTDNVYL